MATLAPLNTPMRQPFGVLQDSKIRSMQSLKNRQNALTPSSAPSLKRRAASPDGSDSENVNPNLLDSFHKRKRSAFDDDVSVSKPRYSLNTVSSTPKRHLETPAVSTSRLGIFVRPSTTPASAPAAAGRSPIRKRQGSHLQSRTRPTPPSFGAKPSSLSISAALSGTLAKRKAKKSRPVPTIEESKAKSWFFDIYEESEETQDYRMNEWTMTQSAYGLDISEDENKTADRLDRGKENVDPNEISAPVTRSMAAAASNIEKISRTARGGKDDMTDDEPRTPLGDLNPTEFYAEGLDATSVVLVHDEVAELPVEQESNTKPEQDFTFSSTTSLSHTSKMIEALDTPSIGQILSQATSNSDSPLNKTLAKTLDMAGEGNREVHDIDIWESESAKDDNEQTSFEILADAEEVALEAETVFALQEL